MIRNKLKALNLTQQNLGKILGHKNKSNISELMNGINPFTLKDLIVINKLMKIEFTELIPSFINADEQLKIQDSLKTLNNPKIKLNSDFSLF